MNQDPVWFGVTSLYAVLVSVVLCQFAKQIGAFLGLLDHPSQIKLHREPTPVMGGVALMAVLLPLTPIFMALFEPEGIGNRALTVIVGATVLMAALGAYDDRVHLRATLRLAAAMAIFLVAMLVENHFVIDRLSITGMGSSFTIPLPIALALSCLIHVGFVNSVNMTDGKNGLVISLCLIWMLALLAVGPIGLVIVLLPLIQMLGVLLVYNLRGRLFLGDGGTYGLSAFLSLVSVYVYRTSEVVLRADQLAVYFLVPGLDMLRLFFARALRGQSPFAGDRQHFHHLLERRFGWQRGLAVYLTLVAVPILAVTLYPLWSLVIFGAGVLTYCVAVLLLWRWEAKEERAVRSGVEGMHHIAVCEGQAEGAPLGSDRIVKSSK